jgi:uncharacterized protein (TIGR03083 family)
MSEHSLSTPEGRSVALFTPAPPIGGWSYAPATDPATSEATMAQRPLRQYYATDAGGPVPVVLDPSFSPMVAPWRAHRARFLGALRGLDEEGWAGPTRCTEWSVRDVVAHLVTVDGFWPVTMATARDGGELTTFLAGFDPSTSPDQFAKSATADLSTAELLERHEAALAGLDAFVAGLDDATWDRPCESPLGHVPARLLLAHGYWDSWLHEYDVAVPRDDAPPVTTDDLVAAAAFSLCFAALQGGLVDDPDAVGPGPGAPIDSCLTFSDLPGIAFHLHVGTLDDGVRVEPCASDHAPVDAGRALDLVDGLAGRSPTDAAVASLPDAVAAQVGRAARTL